MAHCRDEDFRQNSVDAESHEIERKNENKEEKTDEIALDGFFSNFLCQIV